MVFRLKEKKNDKGFRDLSIVTCVIVRFKKIKGVEKFGPRIDELVAPRI